MGQLNRQQLFRDVLLVGLVFTLFAACERQGIVNFISGSPQEAAKGFLQDLAAGKGDYGWHWLHPTLRDQVRKEEYIEAVRSSNIPPFLFEICCIDRDEANLASVWVRIEFANPQVQLPPTVDRVLKGSVVSQDGRSVFKGYLHLRKQGFHWWVDECCG